MNIFAALAVSCAKIAVMKPCLAIFAVLFAAQPLAAAELVMFESPICEWCEKWDEDISGVYPKTSEGKAAPLRRVDIYDPRPDDLKDVKGITFTPTFVLWDEGREIGRIVGYPGEDFFWGLLGEILEKLDD